MIILIREMDKNIYEREEELVTTSYWKLQPDPW